MFKGEGCVLSPFYMNYVDKVATCIRMVAVVR